MDAQDHNVTPKADRLDLLLEELFVNGLSAEGWGELAELLEGNPAAQKRYVETMQLCSMAHDVSVEGGPNLPTFAVDPGAFNTFETKQSSGSSVALSNPLRVRNWLRYLLPIAVAASVAFVAGYWGPRMLAPGADVGRGVAFNTAGDPTENQFAASNSVVAQPKAGAKEGEGWSTSFAQRDKLGVVTALSPEASADGLIRSLQVGEQLRCGEVVQLTVGMMRVQLADGPQMLIEGPAEFCIIGSGAVFLRDGRLHAEGGQKCIVQTPLITVDGGRSEIAVTAEREANATAFAYNGTVQVHSNARRSIAGVLLKTLEAGQGVALTAKTSPRDLAINDSPAPEKLARDWSEVERGYHPYEQLVLSRDPLAYWPLEHVRRNRRVLDLTQHGFDGQAIGDWPLETTAIELKEERGVRFNGKSYIEPDRKPPVDLQRGFTVESWAKVQGGPEFQSIFTSRWVWASNTPTQQCFGFTLYAGDDDHWEFWSGSGEYGKPWQELVSPQKLTRDEWTHVAATFTPTSVEAGQHVDGVVRLYVNGQEIGHCEQRMSLMDFEWPARIGAAEFVPRSLTSWLFNGELRDVALYNYVMTAAQLGEHHQVGRDAI